MRNLGIEEFRRWNIDNRGKRKDNHESTLRLCSGQAKKLENTKEERIEGFKIDDWRLRMGTSEGSQGELTAYRGHTLSGIGMTPILPGLILGAAVRVIRWLAGLRTQEVQVDDHRWVYLEGGKGETMLFVHGFGAEKDSWGPFLRPFSRSYRLIVPDLPGFGESSHIPSASYDVPTQVKRLHRFVETINLPPFHLVGVSLGGYISAYYASEYPERVKSLALMDAAGVESRIPSCAMEIYKREGEIILLYKTLKQFDALTRALFYRPPPMPALYRKYFAKRGARNYGFHEKILQDLEKSGMNLLEDRLSEIMARTLILWGEQDRMVHVSSVEKFEKGIQNSRTVIVKKCGHVPFFEKRKETVRAYEAFLRTVQGEHPPGR